MLSKEELGRYLKNIRNNKGLSLREVNKLTDISYTHLNMIENGKRNVTPALLRNLANLYSVDYLDLYKKAGYIDLIEDEQNKKLENKQAYPLLGTVKGGYDYLSSENIVGHILIDNPLSDIENCYALKVTGDSMYPLMGEGDIIIVHKQENFENGQTCIILINGEEATVKNVYKTENGIKLVALNPYVPPKEFTFEEMKDIPVKIIGVVKEVRNRSSFK